MKHKTSELEGVLLDAAVALAEGAKQASIRSPFPHWEFPGQICIMVDEYRPSTDWERGGPLIERELPAFRPGRGQIVADIMNEHGTFIGIGSTYLVAFARAYVASKFGEQVELP